MDYHLDWIEIALYLAENPGIDQDRPFKSPGKANINTSQQDVDLLVAFDTEEAKDTSTHLVLIEAKAYLPWLNGQLSGKPRRRGKTERCGKAERLGWIFGDGGTNRGIVTPHFVLMTGRESPNVQCADWPSWMKDESGKPFWLKYALPCRRSVQRCRPDGAPDKCGGYVRLRPAAPSIG